MSDVSIKIEVDSRPAEDGARRVKAAIDGIFEALKKLPPALGDPFDRLPPKIRRTRGALAEMADAMTLIRGPLDGVASRFRVLSSMLSESNKGAVLLGLGLAGIGATVGIGISLASEYQQMSNKLRLVATDSENLAQLQKSLFDVAQNTRSELAGSFEMYSRYATVLKGAGYSQQEMLRLTELTNKAIAISGSSTQSAAGALYQFSQGLGSGLLRGQEFNSVLEQARPLAVAIAEGLGMTIPELRRFANDGLLTTQKVIEGLTNSGAKLDEMFNKMGITIPQAATKLKNAFLNLFGEIDKSTGVTKFLAEGIESIANSITELSKMSRLELGIAALGLEDWVKTLSYADQETMGLRKETSLLNSIFSNLNGSFTSLSGASRLLSDNYDLQIQKTRQLIGVKTLLAQKNKELSGGIAASTASSDYINNLIEKSRSPGFRKSDLFSKDAVKGIVMDSDLSDYGFDDDLVATSYDMLLKKPKKKKKPSKKGFYDIDTEKAAYIEETIGLQNKKETKKVLAETKDIMEEMESLNIAQPIIDYQRQAEDLRGNLTQTLIQFSDRAADLLTAPWQQGETAISRMRQFASDMLRQIANDILRAQISSRVANWGNQALGAMFGTYTSPTTGSTFMAPSSIPAKPMFASAKGNVFSNSVVGPSIFPMSNGSFGSLSEKPGQKEGVLPLTRDAQGRLGVISVGGNANSGGQVFAPSTVVNYTSSGGDSASDPEHARRIATMVDDMLTQKFAEFSRRQNRPGGTLNPYVTV